MSQTDAANEAWEAAQSILQALNIGSILQQVAASTAGVSGAEGERERAPRAGVGVGVASQPTVTPSYPPPIIAGDILLGPSSASSSTAGPGRVSSSSSSAAAQTGNISNAYAFTQSVSQDQNVPPSGRAALQGSLALLTAQLADIAGAAVITGSEL